MRRIKWLPEIGQESVIMVLVVGMMVFGFLRALHDGTGSANFNDYLPQNLIVECVAGEQALPETSGVSDHNVLEIGLTLDGDDRRITYSNYTIEGPLYRDVTRGQRAQYSLAQNQEETETYVVAKIIAPRSDPSFEVPVEFGVTLLVNGGDEIHSDWFALYEDHTATYGSAPIDYALAKNEEQDVSEYEQHGTWTLEENGNQKTYVLDFESVSLRMSIDRV